MEEDGVETNRREVRSIRIRNMENKERDIMPPGSGKRYGVDDSGNEGNLEDFKDVGE